ncbi:response regulator [Ideonella azotifigens]|uniref:Response regulator n=1 Tax=Ideonella azotifigens TaxID=513160 RepID=A0ABN1KHI8_9BURK|nr:HD domain-containing phosphohydrolase [Ideonella azotifigens]MCD2344210.1 response regulator [Ideonella azotifigens]
MTVTDVSWSAHDRLPYRVLAVDDDPLQCLMVGEILEAPRYIVTVAGSGAAALARLREQDFDIVLLDKSMPDIGGDEVCRRIRRDLGLTLLPVLIVTGSGGSDDLMASLQAGANDFVRKPYLPAELQARVDSAAQRKRATDQLDSAESLLFALARLVEAKDENTGDHCSRLSRNSVLLGQAMGLTAPELLALRRGGVLHDIGKLGIPDAILMKAGALDDDEWKVMRQHTVIGASLVDGLKSMRLTVPIVRHHHERWDGSGYPDGLAGEAIPLLARVFQVVDIYDALRFARPYKEPFPPERALEILESEAARGWRDPRIVAAFVALVRRHPEQLNVDADANDDLGESLFRRVVDGLSGVKTA